MSESSIGGRRSTLQEMGVFVAPGVDDAQIRALVDEDRRTHRKPIYATRRKRFSRVR